MCKTGNIVCKTGNIVCKIGNIVCKIGNMGIESKHLKTALLCGNFKKSKSVYII